jgi:ornithine carbamoyltransferase
MEMAVVQLGGHPVYTRGEEVGFDTREPVEDVARIMEGYHALIAARVFDHLTVTRMAAVVDVPVVNMLSDHSHPLQAFADALTMQQCLGDLAGKTVAYVGDYNNVARSLAEISAMLGMHIRLACPHGFDAAIAELERFELLGAASVEQSTPSGRRGRGRPRRPHRHLGVDGSGSREAGTAPSSSRVTRVDASMMALADPAAVFMHCLPAYRGIEVAAEVIDGPQSVVFQQGHNRLHAARGALAFLLQSGVQG